MKENELMMMKSRNVFFKPEVVKGENRGEESWWEDGRPFFVVAIFWILIE